MKKTIKKNFVSAFLINVLVLFIYYKFYNLTYETNDEWAFSSFLSGAYGVRSARLVFSNVFYGEFLKVFYSLDLGINWFTIFQVIFCFVSFCTITYICLMRTESYGKRLLRCFYVFAALIIFGFQHYYYIQWTKSAYLIALAGVLLMFYALHECKENKLLIAAGCALVLVGSLLRFDTVYVILAYAFVRCVYDLLIEQRFRFNKEFILRNRTYVLAFITMLVLIFGFKFADGLVYKYGDQSAEWKYYEQYNNLRSELVDYGIPDYTQNLESYTEMGLSDTDITMLWNWSFSDPEVFNVEYLQNIVALKAKKELTFNHILNTYSNILDGAKRNIGIIVVFVGVMFLMKSKKKQQILFPLYMLVTFLLYGYLTYMARLALRVEYGIWLSLLVFFIYDYPKNEENDKSIMSKVAWVMMSVFVLTISLNSYKANAATYTMPLQMHYRQLFDYTNEHKENLYMRDVFTLSNWSFGFSPREALPYGYLSNIYLLGGWEVGNPITSVQQNYGIENPWRECVDADNIFIIDNIGIDIKLAYIREHYCPTAEAVLVENVAGFNIYKIVSN